MRGFMRLPSDTPAGARRAPSPQEIVPGAGEDRTLGPLSRFTSGRVHPNLLFQQAYAVTLEPKANFAIFVFILQICRNSHRGNRARKECRPPRFNRLIRGRGGRHPPPTAFEISRSV